MKHYSLSELEKYQNNDLNFFRNFIVKHHLQTCEECKERLATLKENEMLIKNIRGAINEDMPKGDDKNYETLKVLLEKSSNLKKKK